MKRVYVLLFLLMMFIAISSFSLVVNLYAYAAISQSHDITGDALQGGRANFTQAGAAGVTLADNSIDFGSGFYNGTCFLTHALINSNTSRECWVNTTTFPGTEDVHVIENTGSTVLSINVSINITDAEQFFCNVAQGCNASSDALVRIGVENNESGACTLGLATTFQDLANNTVSTNVNICDRLKFGNSADSIKAYVEFQVPKDSNPGNKTLTLNYEAIAV